MVEAIADGEMPGPAAALIWRCTTYNRKHCGLGPRAVLAGSERAATDCAWSRSVFAYDKFVLDLDGFVPPKLTIIYALLR
jgi:hypothetical protein